MRALLEAEGAAQQAMDQGIVSDVIAPLLQSASLDLRCRHDGFFDAIKASKSPFTLSTMSSDHQLLPSAPIASVSLGLTLLTQLAYTKNQPPHIASRKFGIIRDGVTQYLVFLASLPVHSGAVRMWLGSRTSHQHAEGWAITFRAYLDWVAKAIAALANLSDDEQRYAFPFGAPSPLLMPHHYITNSTKFSRALQNKDERRLGHSRA